MKISVVYNSEKEKAAEFAGFLKTKLTEHLTFFYELKSNFDENLLNSDLVVTLGGDGTTLKTVFFLANNKDGELPEIISVNFGRKGYLSSCKPHLFLVCFESYLQGNCKLIKRRLAKTSIAGEENAVYFLNEIAILRHNDGQVIDLEMVAESFRLQVRADGIICATDTGSTAYSYSAGGARLIGLDDGIASTFLAPEERVGPFVFGVKAQPIKVRCFSTKASLSIDGSIYRNVGPYELKVSVSDRWVKFVSVDD